MEDETLKIGRAAFTQYFEQVKVKSPVLDAEYTTTQLTTLLTCQSKMDRLLKIL
jgi:hypothetical protein